MRVAANVLVNYTAQFIAAFISFAFLPFYLQRLGAAAYGFVGLFAIAQSLFSLLDAGVGQFLTREIVSIGNKARAIDVAQKSTKIFLLVAIIMSCLMFLGKDIVRLYSASPELVINDGSFGALLLIVSLLLGFKSIESIQRSLLYGLNQQVRYSVYLSLVSVAKALGLWILLTSFSSNLLLIYFIWQLVCSVLLIALSENALVLLGAPGLAFDIKNKSRVPGFDINSKSSVFILGASILTALSMLYLQVDKLVVANHFGLSQFGIYAFAGTAAASIAYFALPVMNALYPTFCDLVSQRNYKLLSISYRKSAQLVNVLILSFVATCTFFSSDLLEVWTRSTDLTENISGLFSLLLVVNAFVSLSGLPSMLLIALGKVELLQKQMIFQLLGYALLLVWLIPVIGIYGAPCAWLVVAGINHVVVLPLTFRISLRSLKLNLFILHDFLSCGFAGFASAAILKLITAYMHIPSVFLLAIGFASCLLSTVFASALFRRDLLWKLKSIFVA